ncbi:DNA ligase 4 [Apiospora arundinis]|uniref:DNA ligase 4 n=1 Tax=Apiospora arundinis TaxID=335852 RepID=A0ABR2I2V2_9PEZI
MPFPYRFVCDLLQQLEEEIRSTNKEKTPSRIIIERWFHEHRLRLDAPTVNGCAVISTILPERRTDRVYGIQAPRLESIVGQALILGSSRVKELRRYKTPGQGVDLGDCVESILSRAPNPIDPEREVTIEDLDEALTRVAAGCRFSSPAIRASYTGRTPQSNNHILGQFFTRLSPRDAKWFSRLILKNYEPIIIEERVVLRAYHALLPRMLKVRDDLQLATDLLQHAGSSSTDPKVIASLLKPTIGTKVGRPPWLKARSIKNCLDIIGRRQVSCEQKIDGEYCQIHVDLSNRNAPIQIFSKSGKDSTQDRRRLHPAIRDSLRIDQQDCPFKMGCILEGELVVYSTKENKVLPFHKIRKHVSRSGSYIGSKNDSQRHDHEHLMIIYYDVLMVDTQSMLGMKHSDRFKRLEKLVTCRKGHAEIVQRQIISFSRHSAASMLRDMFARCIVAKGEGLVLKPDEPYFEFDIRQSRFGSCVVKLKKEYVQGWGDVGDFAVIGASYDPVKAKSYNIAKLKWTYFFIGCLENRDRARARSEKPAFVITNIVELPETLLQTLRTHCEPRPVPFDDNESFTLDFRGVGCSTKPTEVFLNPLVFDMRCFSFDKESNSRSWSMRFPYVSKIHFDRSYLDTISFMELQQAAYNAIEAPELEDSQEMRHWISALEKADPRGRAVDDFSQDTVFSDTSTRISQSPSRASLTRDGRRGVSGIESASESTSGVTTANASNKAPLGLATPPKPSAIEAKTSSGVTTGSTNLDGSAKPVKRAAGTPGPNTISKRQRGSVGLDTEHLPPAVPSHTSSMTCPPRDRRPLGSVNGNNSPAPSMFVQTRRQTMPSSPMGENGLVSSAAGSFHTANELPSSPPRYAWVTDDLLKNHGIVNFEVDPEAWKCRPSSSGSSFSSSPGVPADAPGQTQRSVKRVRVRKICLVETRRPEATYEFLKRIEEVGLKRRNGQREWVAVYDWKILEDFANIEAGVAQKGPDPWRQRYVGIA